MKTIFKLILTIIKILTVVLGVLFAVYFWNLDQKLMASRNSWRGHTHRSTISLTERSRI